MSLHDLREAIRPETDDFIASALNFASQATTRRVGRYNDDSFGVTVLTYLNVGIF